MAVTVHRPAPTVLCDAACAVLRAANGPLATTLLAAGVAQHLGHVPDDRTRRQLVAAARSDQRLWWLPDGRWVDLPSAVHGRLLGCPAVGPAGVLPVDVDLATAVLPYRWWDRLPVRAGGRRGIAERAITPSGADVLVLPPGLLDQVSPPLAAVPGPEGIAFTAAPPIDEVADLRLHRAVGALARRHAAAAGPVARDPRPGRGWTVTDVEVAVLATDPTAWRSSIRPLSAHIPDSAKAGRPDGRPAVDAGPAG
jgi:hypothetical protein